MYPPNGKNVELVGCLSAEWLCIGISLDGGFQLPGNSDVPDLPGCPYDQGAYVPERPVQVPNLKSEVKSC